MRRKSYLLWVTMVIMCLSLMTPYFCKKVRAMSILETDVETASDGCTMLGVYGSYYSQAQDALNRINEIRKEACEAGNVPDPRNKSRVLTADDYVPVKWSRDLESVARIRAMEAGLAYSFMGSGHNRLNGGSIFDLSYNGVSSGGEDLAYNWGTSMVSGINQWYAEKSDWVNQVSGKVTGHYTSMINPQFTYVGLGDFYTEEAAYPNTLAGEFCSSSQNLDQTMQTAQTDVMQKIEVKDSYITGYVLEGVDTIYTDKTTTLTPKASLINGSNTHKLWVIGNLKYYSSDTSVATVTDEGVVTGVKNGTTTITAKIDGSTLASTVITVKCGHVKELVSETQPTCTATGIKVYSCEICGESIEQVVPKVAHVYVYGEADSAGNRTGVCSVCGDTIEIIPPTTYTLWWGTAAYGNFSSVFPSSRAVGSSVYCWIDGVDGDSKYRDMVIESTDESVISVPETVIANSSNNKLDILAPGISTLTIYPKYNASLKKQVVVRIGDSGSVDITSADVTLSQTYYEYSGTACTPLVTISYHDTKLTKGTDYKVTYENNTEAGTATVVITGSGIFTGTIRKDFTIVAEEHTEHVYGAWKVVTAASCNKKGEKRRYCTVCNAYETAVIDELPHTPATDPEVPATCTESGLTAGSHCSVCGIGLVAQNIIEPTGHNYVDGTCQHCGDIIYIDKNGLHYTIIDKSEDSHRVSVTAANGEILEGEVNIPSMVEINGEDYSVTVIGENAFAGQDVIASITVPDTVTKIDNGAFSHCDSLTNIIFGGAVAPIIADDIFTGTESSSLVIHVPYNATGYDDWEETTGVALEKDHVHAYGAWKVVTAASCNKKGEKRRYCTVCNAYETAVIDELPHTPATDPEVPATCTESGLTTGSHCSVCGTGLVAQNIVKPTGHNWNTNYTIDVPATETTTGAQSIHCRNCNATKDQKEIPATGKKQGADDGLSGPGDENKDDGNGTQNGDATDDSDEDDEDDNVDNVNYPKVGDTFTIKGLKYKVVSSNPGDDEYEVSCIGTNSKNITKLNVPNYVSDDDFDYEVVSVGKKAFSGCKKIKTLSLSDFVTTIGDQAFYGCTSLKKITIPAKTKQIGAQAFAKCKQLSLVNIKSSLLTEKNVGKQAFTGINKKAVVKVPSKKKAVYKKWLKKKGLTGKNQKVH